MDEKWKLSYTDEIYYWYKNILNIYTYQNGICPKCHKHTLGINESKKKNILNPIFARCSNKACKKISIKIFFISKIA